MKMFPDEYDYLQITLQLDYLFNSVFNINPFTHSYLLKNSKESSYYLPLIKNQMGYTEKVFDESTIEELLIRLLPSLGDPDKRAEYVKRLSEDTDSETIAKALAKMVYSSQDSGKYIYFEKYGSSYRFKYFNKYLSYLFGLIEVTFNLSSEDIKSIFVDLNSSKCIQHSRVLSWKNDKQEYYTIARDYGSFISIWKSEFKIKDEKVSPVNVDEENQNKVLRKDYTNPFHKGPKSIDPYIAINELISILKECGIKLK